MVTLSGINYHDKNGIRARTDAVYCIVKMGYCKFKIFCDLVKIMIRYAHVPHKIVDIGNVLLVGI